MERAIAGALVVPTRGGDARIKFRTIVLPWTTAHHYACCRLILEGVAENRGCLESVQFWNASPGRTNRRKRCRRRPMVGLLWLYSYSSRRFHYRRFLPLAARIRNRVQSRPINFRVGISVTSLHDRALEIVPGKKRDSKGERGGEYRHAQAR